MTSTVLTLTTDDQAHTDLCAALAVILPAATVERVDPGLVRRLPPAAALIVDDPEHARIARATGFAGPIVIARAPENGDSEIAFRAQHTRHVAPPVTPAQLADALDGALHDAASDALRDALVHTRKLLAAGEIALGLQHAFNNPLTALMAEVQLLQIDATTDEVRGAADRMYALVRRLTALSRSLDAVRDHGPAS